MLTAAADPLALRLKRGIPLAVAWLALGSPAIAEIALGAGADGLVIDRQHGLWDRAALEAAVGASGERPVLVRTADHTPTEISAALDAGADGILVPLVETAADAAAVVACGRFPPAGRRSGGGVRPLAMGFPRYLAAADHVTIGVMIETAAGVEAADAIAATPGLDLILIGTGDLRLSYAATTDPDAAREAGVARVLAACRNAGIAPGIFTMGPDDARRRRMQGFQLTVAANDIDVLNTGFSAAAAALR